MLGYYAQGIIGDCCWRRFAHYKRGASSLEFAFNHHYFLVLTIGQYDAHIIIITLSTQNNDSNTDRV